ncbi:putative transposase, Ptta/En/Spm, plant [Rosa chinensis]|uniref:Putative transposase, Ptta/En/Spm, plant n=1 Tax=Rosa chinensis TaxID=74649 RepID=A0A2P6SBQ1_ROSCH|nr:putative transposase, Ptta/En/Spm, plant [Rosa chinensis]
MKFKRLVRNWFILFKFSGYCCIASSSFYLLVLHGTRISHITFFCLFFLIRFLVHMYVEKKNGGVNPDRCKMFELTHVHDNENPDEPNSKQAIALMKDKIDKMKTTKRASQLPEALNDFEINEVYASVLGKETRGGVRGFGIGVRPEQVPGVLVQKRGVHLEVQAMREQHEAEIETIRKESQEKEDKLREELNKQTLATKDKFKNMEIAMKKQEALMALLLGAYESTDMLGAALRMKGASFQPSMSHIQSSYEENLDDVYIPHCSEELRQQVTRN